MDATAHYMNLVTLGREEFLASAAPAALVRRRIVEGAPGSDLDDNETIEQAIDHTLPLDRHALLAGPALEVFPIVKKPGASFPDRITIGRTPNNDIVIPDASISRLHAYLKAEPTWVVADAGSKNGSWLAGLLLEPRKERALIAHQVLRLGDVDLTFYLAADLFSVLQGES